MTRRRSLSLLACTAALGLVSTLGLLPAAAAPARGGAALDLALIADTPYGDAQRAQFPALLQAINADPTVRWVLHAGDVKNGSSTCDDARFADLAALYGTFADPFVITPGDNEWTDCHRTAAGRYLPTERLDAVRRTFFPRTGRTLGQRTEVVSSQGYDPQHKAYVENVRFTRNRVTFATVHVVGSDNDLEPWSQLVGGDRPALRLAEFEARQAAALSWIDTAFESARATDSAGVLLMMQAEPTTTAGFRAIRERIAQRTREYGRPVLLVHGDEHVYEVERSYAGVPNLTRLETYGDTAVDWLKLTVNPRTPGVFSWVSKRVPGSAATATPTPTAPAAPIATAAPSATPAATATPTPTPSSTPTSSPAPTASATTTSSPRP